jgi:hypothetical protein
MEPLEVSEIKKKKKARCNWARRAIVQQAKRETSPCT